MVPPDPHGLDADEDGIGCESSIGCVPKIIFAASGALSFPFASAVLL